MLYFITIINYFLILSMKVFWVIFFYIRGAFGVDIFFVLSRFLMYFVALKTKSNIQFLIKRVARVFPAYIFFTSYNLKSLFFSYLMIPAENPSGLGYFPLLTVGWALSLELCFYLIVYFSLVFNKKYFFFLVIIISYIFPYFLKIGMFEYMRTFIYGFIFAYFYNRYNLLSIILSKNEIRVFIAFIALILFSGTFGWDIQIRAICATLILIFFLEVKDDLASKFKIFGDISYSTYLFHSIPMLILMHYINLANSNVFISTLSVFFFSIVIFVVSLLGYKYIETSFLYNWNKENGK
ncbi:acyltransferase 3 [Francisella cf. novicida Fx1]|nr:acyltransferase 3 [Francisella cf. novicida Fx1]